MATIHQSGFYSRVARQKAGFSKRHLKTSATMRNKTFWSERSKMELFQASNISTLKPGGGSCANNFRNWETSRHRGNNECSNVQRSSSRALWTSGCADGSWGAARQPQQLFKDVEMALPIWLDGAGEVRHRRSVHSPTADVASSCVVLEVDQDGTRPGRYVLVMPESLREQLAPTFPRTVNHYLELSEVPSCLKSSPRLCPLPASILPLVYTKTPPLGTLQ